MSNLLERMLEDSNILQKYKLISLFRMDGLKQLVYEIDQLSEHEKQEYINKVFSDMKQLSTIEFLIQEITDMIYTLGVIPISDTWCMEKIHWVKSVPKDSNRTLMYIRFDLRHIPTAYLFDIETVFLVKEKENQNPPNVVQAIETIRRGITIMPRTLSQLYLLKQGVKDEKDKEALKIQLQNIQQLLANNPKYFDTWQLFINRFWTQEAIQEYQIGNVIPNHLVDTFQILSDVCPNMIYAENDGMVIRIVSFNKGTKTIKWTDDQVFVIKKNANGAWVCCDTSEDIYERSKLAWNLSK